MQARVQQAQQLAEARQRHVQAKTLSSKSPEKAEIERLQSELATAMDEIDVAKQKETEVYMHLFLLKYSISLSGGPGGDEHNTCTFLPFSMKHIQFCTNQPVQDVGTF